MQYRQVFVPQENIYIGFDALDLPQSNFLHFDRDQWSHNNEDGVPTNKFGPSLFQKGSWNDAQVDDIPHHQVLSQKQAPIALLQQKNVDIAEKGMDEDVHHFTNPLTETLNWPRRDSPYDANGSSSKAFKP